MRVSGQGTNGTRWWQLATMLALFAMLLMPVSYRAGSTRPHGHALIQLIHEAQAGIPVHHHGVDEMDPHHQGGDVASALTGAPPILVIAASALLPMILLALALRTLRSTIRQGSDTRPAELAIAPGHPPPELA